MSLRCVAVLSFAILASCRGAEDSPGPAAARAKTVAPPKTPDAVPLTDADRALVASRSNPWRSVSDGDLDRDIAFALTEAKASKKRVLLDFVADWCDDCQEVTRVLKVPPASDVAASAYVVVPVNVGAWDRAERLRTLYGVKRIAALVVLAADGTRVAQTTLEPVSNKTELTPVALAAWLTQPVDDASAVPKGTP
jgi:thiol-disulfide isomerase/thioredoxin